MRPLHPLPLTAPTGDPDPPETLGERLARLRRARGLTQGEVADRLGVTVATISYWEHDRSRPKAARLQSLALLLGIAVAELLGPEIRNGAASLPLLIARMRSEIASAAGTSPSKVRIVIEM